MDRFDRNLVEIISQGDSIVLVGSGVSVGTGYPTWGGLVKIVYEGILPKCDKSIQEKYKNLWEKNQPDDFLKFFDFAVETFGKNTIVSIIEEAFNKIHPSYSELYSIITDWPIKVYLTTNYDSELKNYLQRKGLIFIEKSNTIDDLRTLNSSAKNYIYKIHGDFRNPDTFILTEKDYSRVVNSPDFSTWREQINAILHMRNVILIGYSAKDPDFKQQLLRAKEIASPSSPVYMFTTGLKQEEIDELYIKENIRVISYSNSDGKHSQLTKLLKQYDAFIPARNSSLVGKTPEQLYESEIASAVFLYNEIFFINSDNSIISKAFSNCILNILKDKSLNLTEIRTELKTKKITMDNQSIDLALDQLCENGYVKKDENIYKLSSKGMEFLSTNRIQTLEYKERFNEYCRIHLHNENVEENEIQKIIAYLHSGLEILFQKRGLEIARKVISEDDLDINLGFDIATAFEGAFSNLNTTEYNHFIDLIINIIQIPTQEVRDYLALLCNGYFIYNILGHDKRAREKRLETLKNKKIYIDSSILISLIASSCQTNNFSLDLLEKLKKYNTDLWITEGLFKELYDHAYWAIANFADAAMENLSLYQAYTGYGYYKQNLFIDGAFNAYQKEHIQYMDTYLSNCLGEGYETELDTCLKEKLASLGISIRIKPEEINKKQEALKEEFTQLIKENRLNNDSYRNDFQCQTEAELVTLAQEEPFCFITQTTNLKKIDTHKKISNWSPEGLYRFLGMNDYSLDLDNLYNCMVSDIYTCGFHVINKEIMDSIAEKFYIQADLKIGEIQRQQNKAINKYLEKDLIDLAKSDGSYPFYAMQVQSKFSENVAHQAAILEQRNAQLEEKQKALQITTSDRVRLAKYDSKKAAKLAKERNKRKNKKPRHKKK